MKIRLHHVDAFADGPFRGNPAAVVVLDDFPSDAWMLAVADENHLSETAFIVPSGGGNYRLRWFTPVAEVDLCGHATLASSWVLWERRGETSPTIRFATKSGELRVERLRDGWLELDFPLREVTPIANDAVGAGLGAAPERLLASSFSYVAVYRTAAEVAALLPDFRALAVLDRHAVIATAPGDDVDFVSRCFVPSVGIDEDPVTGAAHCSLTPYWAARLGRTSLVARQISRRGGRLRCRLDGDRVRIAGTVVPYLEGEIDGP
jgi:predicted PhzF superfamily epimerase YddE/YHI9